jgi:hypothetical protein
MYRHGRRGKTARNVALPPDIQPPAERAGGISTTVAAAAAVTHDLKALERATALPT